MPNKNFNDLTIATTTDGTELVPVVSSGVTSAISVSNINSGIIADTISDITNADDLSVGQSSIAAGVSSLVSSITQQDLSGVNTVALHRSPNAITSMFIYDTSKDSDGGAWTEKCQHTSWYNESLSGKWLGAQTSESSARAFNSILGITEYVLNGNTFQDTTGWSAFNGATFTTVNGSLKVLSTAQYAGVSYTINGLIQGKLYVLTRKVSGNTGVLRFRTVINGADAGGITILDNGISATESFYFVAGATNSISFISWNTIADFYLSNVSVREAVSQGDSGSYFQLTSDGKFYRLWKNLLKYSEKLEFWTTSAANVIPNATTSPIGDQSADKLVENLSTNYHYIQQGITSIPSSNYIISFYIKAGERTICGLEAATGSTTRKVLFDTTNVTATLIVGSGTPTIASVGNGWYKCTLQFVTDSGTSTSIVLFPNSVYSYAGDGSSGIYIWGVQLEYGSMVTTYEPKGIEGSSSEVFRGNKKSFPKLSAVVAEASNVTIYDLTESGRPMWMRFVRNTGNILQLESASKVYSLLAINSVIYIGQGAAGVCLNEVNFYKDSAEAFAITTTDGGKFKSNIAGRNSGVGRLPTTITTPAGRASVMSFVILDGSPIDNISGLPIPTLAIGYNSGVFFKKNNGTFSTNWNSSFGELTTLYFKKKFIIASGWQSGSFAYATFNPTIQEITGWTNNTSTDAVDFNIGNTYGLISSTSNDVIRKSSNSATVQKLKPCDMSINNSIASTITNTYNTGHQIGDIRRTYLSDISTGTVNGDTIQLITPSSIDINWIDNGNGSFSANGSYGSLTFTGPIFKFGKVFTVTFTLVRNSNTLLASNKSTGVWDISLGSSGTFTYTLPIYSSESFTFYGNGLNGTLSNIYVTEKNPDRSYKASAATITGTLTKTQVATGSQLVAYSGFSA